MVESEMRRDASTIALCSYYARVKSVNCDEQRKVSWSPRERTVGRDSRFFGERKGFFVGTRGQECLRLGFQNWKI